MLRHLLSFLLLGTLLFAGKRTWLSDASTQPALTVHVPARATRHEVEVAIEEAVLLEWALASKGALADPIVREQLLRAMQREADKAQDDRALVDQAVQLGLHRADPLVRQRLIFQAKQVLRAGILPSAPSDAELLAYLTQHRERYEIPAQRSFQQVFIQPSRHGEALDRVVRETRERLAHVQAGAALPSLSDPTLLPARLDEASEHDVAARFGPELAEHVFTTDALTFEGPVRSSYGLHFVRVDRREPARLPALSAVRKRVEGDLLHDRLDRDFQRALRELLRSYRVQVLRSAS